MSSKRSGSCAGDLIGSAGGNVDSLKIRPPLVIGRSEVELLLEALERALAR
jgi:4-aminobutyrate aminotransferase-like enzyme